MTDRTQILAAPTAMTFGAIDKAHAFRAATRHSVRVRILRIATIGGALALMGGIALFAIVDPFHAGLKGVSIEGASLDGTKVTMANPRLSGYHKDGRPYTITAASAVQDIKAPTIFELHDIKAQLTEANKSVTKLSAASGVYNSTDETMHLTSPVRIVGDGGLDVQTQDAKVLFKTNAMSTDKPVTVAIHGSTVAADAMQVVEGGEHVTFEGHVHSLVQTADAATGDGAVASAPGAAP